MAEEMVLPHSISIDERRLLRITGVSDVDSFDEETVIAYTSMGELHITGKELRINHLDTQTGDLTVDGEIGGLAYTTHKPVKGGLFSRLIR